MADTDVKRLEIRIDANTELMRAETVKAAQSVEAFELDVERTLNRLEQKASGVKLENLSNSIKAVESEFRAGFSNIQKIAAQAIEGPRLKSGELDLGVAGAKAAADAARAQAIAVGLIADAAQRAATAEGELSRENQVYVRAAEAARTKANLHADALAKQAGALERLQIEMRATGGAQEVLDGHQRRSITVSGQQRNAFQQLSFQANDVAVGFAAGTPPMIIFAQQSGQVIQALGLMTNNTKGLLGFLAGPWGLAFTTALVVLTPFVGKLLEGNDELEKALDKLKKDARQTEISRQAKEAFTKTIEGQIAAQRELNAQLERGIQSQRQQDQAQLRAARDSLKNLEKSRNDLEKELVQARQRAKQAENRVRNPSPLDGPEGAQGNLAAATIAAQRVAALEGRLKAVNDAISLARVSVRDAQVPIAIDAAKAAIDPIAAVNKKYDEMRDAAIDAARGNDQLTASLAKTLAAIERQRNADVTKAQAAKTLAGPAANRQFGREITRAEAFSIVRSIGGTPTSGTRSFAQQSVLYDRYKAGIGPLAAKPGTSLHEQGLAVDIAKSGGVTLAKIRKAFADEGVRLTELLDEGSHFHAGFGKKGSAPETIEKREAAERRSELSDDLSYTEQERQARRKLVEASARTAASEADREALIREDINAEAAAQSEKIRIRQEQGQISEAEAKHLTDLNERTRLQLLQNVEIERQSQTIADQTDATDRSLNADIAILRIKQDMAVTTAERQRLAEQILEKEQQQARLRIQQVLDDPKASDASKAQAKIEKARLPEIEASQRDQRALENESPLERYRREVGDVGNKINDSLERVQIDGLESLNDGLTEAILNSKSLGSVFKNVANAIIADLIRIAVQQAIVAPLLKALGGGSGGGGIFGSLFGGARASGGPVTGGKTYLVGEKGPELFTAPGSGSIISNDDLSALRNGRFRMPSVAASVVAAGAANQNGGVVRIEVAEGSLFEPRVEQISGNVSVEVVRAAAPGIMEGAQRGAITALNRSRL